MVVKLDPYQTITRLVASTAAQYVSFTISIVGQVAATYYERTVDTDSPSDLICAVPVEDTQDKYLIDSVSHYAFKLTYSEFSFVRYVDGAWVALDSESMVVQGSIPGSGSGFSHQATYPEWYGTFEHPNILSRAHFMPVPNGSASGIPVPFNPTRFFNGAVAQEYCAQIGFLGIERGSGDANFVCRDTAGIPYFSWLPAAGNVWDHVIGEQADVKSLFTCKVNGVTWPTAGLATIPDIRTSFDNIDAPRTLIVLCRKP